VTLVLDAQDPAALGLPSPLDLPPLDLADPVAARRTLRAQIARLEGHLRTVLAEDPCRETRRVAAAADAPVADTGPRVLDLGELERVRDDLVARVEAVRVANAVRERRTTAARDLLAAMYADPDAHRGARLTSADLGESGCTRWRVRPVLGVVGRLSGWWRVRVSSGCP